MKRVSFLHFHDIMGGCCIKSAYDESYYMAEEAISIARIAENNAVQSLSWKIDTENAPGQPIVLFNPHPWRVTALVRANTNTLGGVLDASGKEMKLQRLQSETISCYGRPDLAFIATVLALGYATYYMYEEERAPFEEENSLSVSETGLENEFLKVAFDSRSGKVTSVFHKKSGKELLGGAGIVPVVVDETEHDTWSHGKNYFDRYVGEFSDAQISVVEKGPLRATVKVVTTYGVSKLAQYWSLCEGSEVLQMRCKLTWYEKNKMLKFAVNADVGGSFARYQLPFGDLLRERNGEEESGQKWAALEGEKGAFVAFNDSKYSSSAKGDTMYLTAMRSPLFGDHGLERNDECAYTDQGDAEFTYAFKYYETPDYADATRLAEELNEQFVVVLENRHKGFLPDTLEGIRVEGDGVVISAIKRAENGKGDIVRAVETRGNCATAVISGRVLSEEIRADLSPYEVKTFLKEDDSSGWREVLLTEFD